MLCNIISIGLTTYFKKTLGYDMIKGTPFSNGYSDTDFAYMLSYLFFAPLLGVLDPDPYGHFWYPGSGSA